MKFRSLLSFLLFMIITNVLVAHQGTTHVEYQQPNGKLLKLHVVGDHLYSRTETADGYTVVFNATDKTYYYAVLNADRSEFVATKVKVGEKAPHGLKKKLKISSESKRKKALARIDNNEEAEREARWQKKLKANKLKRMQKLKEMRERKLKKQRGQKEDVKQEDAEVDAVKIAPNTPDVAQSENTDENLNFDSQVLNTLADPETTRGLTILVQFPDDPETTTIDPVNFPATREKIERYCNEIGYNDDGNTGSIRDYFTDQSIGLLDYTMNVTQIITMPNPRNYYNYEDYPANTTLRASGQSGRLLMADSAEVLNNANFDFSDLSLDSSGNVISTNILFAGNTSGVWPLGLWPHRWSTAFNSRPQITINGVTRYLYRYQITNLPNNSARIGTFIHESGHLLLSYPDLYDYGGDSSGIGTHGIMASGNHLNGGKSPAPINIYFKDIVGWANITDIEAFDYVEASLPATGNVGYRITNPDNVDEFFIIENRGYAGGAIGGDKWAISVPDEGIAIWHVDDDVRGNDDQQMTEALHYQVSLEQQDGEFDLENDRGADSQDLYDNNSSIFDDNSFPNAHWWNGAPSGISINIESSPGVSMNVTFGLDVDLAVISPNGGEVLLEGEEVNIQWNGNATGNVKIDLLKNGTLVETLAANEINDGSFLWTITSAYEKAHDYRIRITIINDGSIIDESDFDFSISSERFVAEGIFPAGWVRSNGSDAGWSVTQDEASEGSYSLTNDIISHNENAQVEYTTTTEAGMITFDAKVSSESRYDFLEFYINGVKQDLSISGDSGWVSYSFPVNAGEHTFQWSYEKDGSVSSLEDRAWIDNVVIPKPALTGIELWRVNHFDGTDLDELADLADPDGDGHSNLLEYAFGTDPNDPKSIAPLSVLKEGRLLSIIYKKNESAHDLVFEYQHRADLGLASWLITDVTEDVLSSSGGIQTMKATMGVLPSEDHHFMRLNVELAE